MIETSRRAGADLGFRRNSAALCVIERTGDKFKLIREREWIPVDRPLKPKVTVSEMIATVRKCGASILCGDIHYIDLVIEELEDTGVEFVQFTVKPEEISEAFLRLKILLSEGLVDLSLASERLLEQLSAVISKPSPGGYLEIIQPTVGGSHGDIVSALIHAFYCFDYSELDERLAGGTRRFYREEVEAEGTMHRTSQEYESDDPD